MVENFIMLMYAKKILIPLTQLLSIQFLSSLRLFRFFHFKTSNQIVKLFRRGACEIFTFFSLKEISFFHAHFSFNWPWYVCPDQKHAQDTIIQNYFFLISNL